MTELGGRDELGARLPAACALLESRSAHALRRALVAGPLMPVDPLVGELASIQDRRGYLDSALHDSGGALGSAVSPEVALDLLSQIRDRAVAGFRDAAATEERNRCLAAFAVAMASGLVHHGVLLTSQPRCDVDLLLAELAGLLPRDLAELFNRAVLTRERRESDG